MRPHEPPYQEHERPPPRSEVCTSYGSLPQPVRIIRRLRWENSLATEWSRRFEARITHLQERLRKLEAELEATAERLADLIEPEEPTL
jgi:uncharacterized coiled-coil DUF342 family protein